MMDGDGEWHYKCVPEDPLHERLSDPSRSGADTQGVVDRLLRRFGAGRLAHVQSAPVGATEGGSDALLSFEDASNRLYCSNRGSSPPTTRARHAFTLQRPRPCRCGLPTSHAEAQ